MSPSRKILTNGAVQIGVLMTSEEMKKARAVLDLTQEQLGHRLEYDRTTVARWETNLLDIPKSVELAVFYLLTREGVNPVQFFA